MVYRFVWGGKTYQFDLMGKKLLSAHLIMFYAAILLSNGCRVSSDKGEYGILGGGFGQGTVPKGEDKPPAIKLPGLDFTSEKGKSLIGY